MVRFRALLPLSSFFLLVSSFNTLRYARTLYGFGSWHHTKLIMTRWGVLLNMLERERAGERDEEDNDVCTVRVGYACVCVCAVNRLLAAVRTYITASYHLQHPSCTASSISFFFSTELIYAKSTVHGSLHPPSVKMGLGRLIR